jgi:hypothetical protein
MKRMQGDATHIMVEDEGRALMRKAYGAQWDASHLEVIERPSISRFSKCRNAKIASRKHRTTTAHHRARNIRLGSDLRV